jgi:Mg-chelatase subunit ChlD
MYPHAILLSVALVFLLVIVTYKTFVRFDSSFERTEFVKSRKRIRFFLLLTRSFMFIMLSIAIATPYNEEVITLPGDPSLKMLADNSKSFELFESGIESLKSQLETKIPTSIAYLATGETSNIGDSIIQNSEGEDNLLLITDGNNNEGRDLGDVILFASKLNTSINMLKINQINSDVGINVVGPKEVIVGTENEYIVRVANVGDDLSYHVEVTIDDEIVIGEEAWGSKDFSFSKKLGKEGYHKIVAELTGVDENDYFEQNNIYYKSIKVVPRPHVLYVTEKESPLLGILQTIYDIDASPSIPSILDYDAIIIDDIPAVVLNSKVEQLNEFVSEKGNGLLVVGGSNSYDRGNYKNSLFETILPVNVGQAEIEEKKSANAIILIDISESTGYTVGQGDIDYEKALAIGMLSDFREDDMVGVAAFNHMSYTVSPLTRLDEKYDLEKRIRALKDIGGTVVLAGLQKADNMLSQARGSKYIIVISDGMTQQKEEAIEFADSLRRRGIKVYTVGVGGKTNREFLINLAEAANGIYFEPDKSQHLRLLFGSSAEPLEEDLSLVMFDSTHFITRGIELRAKVSGLNFVVPKTSGRMIITTNEGYPIITTWRYGLGRVAVFSTDNGDKWGGELLSANNFKMIGRLVNWAVGDLSRNKVQDITIDDVSLGERTDIVFVSSDVPESQELSFAKVDANLYVASTDSNETGFYEYGGAFGAVNYKKEYGKLGLNEELIDLVTISGGHIFEANNAEEIAKTIKTISRRKKVDFITFRWPFTSLAISLFLFEIFIRRMRENKLGRR